MEAKMADIFLTFSVEGVLNKVTSLAAQEYNLARGFRTELTKLKQSLLTIQNFLANVAHQPQGLNEAVADWVKELKDVAHDADNVLDEIDYEALRRRVKLQNHIMKKVLFKFLSPSILFRQKMAHKIEKINASLASLEKKAAVVLLASTVNPPIANPPQSIIGNRETDSFLDDNDIIVGREDDLKDIIKNLIDSKNQKNLSVMTIVGMAGLGKTALAKLVFNDKNDIHNHFDEKIWVCVSITFDVNSILNKILQSLDATKATVNTRDALIRNLQLELANKRYLLVLDDVWNNDSEQWSHLMRCLSQLNNAHGNTIILTTRNATSIRQTLPGFHLNPLSQEQCWSILEGRAFPNGHCSDPDLERIGREIARKCAGVPLVAKVLGSMFRSKTANEWSEIENSEIWNLDTEDRIKSILRLSFDNLKSPYLRQCFSYCSLLIKDFKIQRDDLIQLWMAQGLLHPSLYHGQNNQEMEEIGNKYFNILLENSLFQDPTKDKYDIIIDCKMHNFVHCLAEEVFKSESLTKSESLPKDFNGPPHFRHVAWIPPSELETMPKGWVRRFLSLFLRDNVPKNILPRFKALRVLNLYQANIEELSISIGKLKHLRYLDVSGTRIKALPKSIGKLYNLQTLRMINCSHLVEFPKILGNLINLRHVYFDEEKKFPMKQLTNLQTIPNFTVANEEGRGIEELADLNKLKGELTISHLENVTDREKAEKANLVGKNIFKLALVWDQGRMRNINNDKDVLEVLQPHPRLEILEIHNFMGAQFPSWIGSNLSSPLNYLKEIRLYGCNKCEGVPTLGHLPKLKHFEIDQMENLKSVGAEFYCDAITTGAITTGALFPELKTLIISSTPNLTEWVEAPVQTGTVKVFPLLEKLSLLNCPQLRKLPNHFPPSVELKIVNNFP